MCRISPPAPVPSAPAGTPKISRTPLSAVRIARRSARRKLKLAIELTREVLEVPAGYRIGIVPASDTGAVEMALWSLLGARPVTTIAWESFGEGWVSDIVKELKLKDVTKLHAGYGEIPDLAKADPASDIVFTWNGTTSGVRVPNADWISATREGLTICDATSAAFAQAARLGQARCRDLLLAEGAGRRSRAWHAGASALARSSGSRPTSRPGRCRKSSA